MSALTAVFSSSGLSVVRKIDRRRSQQFWVTGIVKSGEHPEGSALMPKRQGNNPKRRIAPKNKLTPEALNEYANQASYTGSAHHKRNPADYGFRPPVSPRPNKSLCDASRTVTLADARSLFRAGMKRGMVSVYPEGGLPKYVWAVDSDGRVYEAKRDGNSGNYHGYELGADEGAMRKMVITEWNLRCSTS